ncbi:MAG: SDR family oxidoreductase [Actinomycetota bacterium]|jgi:short-subunit dehydrogenase
MNPVMLITGGTRGIGAAIARAASQAGYTVAITFETSDVAADELVSEGSVDLAIRSDAGDEAAVVAAFAEVVETYGRVDALINNAGIAGSYGTIDTVTGDMLERLWAVNISAPFLFAREAVRHMSTANGGRGGCIVNISSKAAVLGGSGEWVHYAASKGALESMTTGLAKEVAAVGIRVNAVRPGLIETDFNEHASPGRVERVRPMVPMQRSGTVEEVAAAVLWLCSDASSYTTGAFVDVSGGR